MIDTHCHIDLYPNPTEVADRANRAKIITILVTNTPTAFEKSYPHIKQFSHIRIALGLHPLLASEHKAERGNFERLVNKTSYIGEVGLDFSPVGIETKNVQIESFKFVFNTINKKPKFITIHSRRAESAVLDLLNEASYPFPVVFHWYSGPLNILDKAIEKGHYFSINPSMIESPNGRKIIARIPLEQILTESDGPFVKIKSRSAEPADVKLVESFIAVERKLPLSSVVNKIKSNFLQTLRPINELLSGTCSIAKK